MIRNSSVQSLLTQFTTFISMNVLITNSVYADKGPINHMFTSPFPVLNPCSISLQPAGEGRGEPVRTEWDEGGGQEKHGGNRFLYMPLPYLPRCTGGHHRPCEGWGQVAIVNPVLTPLLGGGLREEESRVKGLERKPGEKL